jgi:hypothetical protein
MNTAQLIHRFIKRFIPNKRDLEEYSGQDMNIYKLYLYKRQTQLFSGILKDYASNKKTLTDTIKELDITFVHLDLGIKMIEESGE